MCGGGNSGDLVGGIAVIWWGDSGDLVGGEGE